jgi:hypothetical protein
MYYRYQVAHETNSMSEMVNLLKTNLLELQELQR